MFTSERLHSELKHGGVRAPVIVVVVVVVVVVVPSGVYNIIIL